MSKENDEAQAMGAKPAGPQVIRAVALDRHELLRGEPGANPGRTRRREVSRRHSQATPNGRGVLSCSNSIKYRTADSTTGTLRSALVESDDRADVDALIAVWNQSNDSRGHKRIAKAEPQATPPGGCEPAWYSSFESTERWRCGSTNWWSNPRSNDGPIGMAFPWRWDEALIC